MSGLGVRDWLLLALVPQLRQFPGLYLAHFLLRDPPPPTPVPTELSCLLGLLPAVVTGLSFFLSLMTVTVRVLSVDAFIECVLVDICLMFVSG